MDHTSFSFFLFYFASSVVHYRAGKIPLPDMRNLIQVIIQARHICSPRVSLGPTTDKFPPVSAGAAFAAGKWVVVGKRVPSAAAWQRLISALGPMTGCWLGHDSSSRFKPKLVVWLVNQTGKVMRSQIQSLEACCTLLFK